LTASTELSNTTGSVLDPSESSDRWIDTVLNVDVCSCRLFDIDGWWLKTFFLFHFCVFVFITRMRDNDKSTWVTWNKEKE
jgi:hypothetical protein